MAESDECLEAGEMFWVRVRGRGPGSPGVLASSAGYLRMRILLRRRVWFAFAVVWSSRRVPGLWGRSLAEAGCDEVFCWCLLEPNRVEDVVPVLEVVDKK